MSDKKLVVHLIANAHLDPVWLWNWPAGVDETIATFRSAADRCDEYPQLIYTRGEAWLFEVIEDLDPILFERIKKLVAAGRWAIAGGQYVQPDANLPTEAGWRKQFEIGGDYFESRFGIRPRIAYNVDTFGHPATLPDILKSCGYTGYVLHRPNQEQMKLPAQTFRWRGSAGGEVLAFRIAPSYVTRSDTIYGQIMMSAEAADRDLGHTMCFYGLGNHGGGPTKATIEYLLANQDKFDGLELRFSSVDAFFAEAEKQRDTLPVVSEELQYTFPGCYSVMHNIKRNQHRGEKLLEQAEVLNTSFEPDPQRAKLATAKLTKGWKDLLFTEFHDILAGTSVPSAWPSAEAKQGRARVIGEEIVVAATRRFAKACLPSINHQQLVAINATDHDFNGWLQAEPFLDFDDWGERWISDLDGNPVPFQLVAPEANMGSMVYGVVWPAMIPARTSRVFLVRDDAKKNVKPLRADLKASAKILDNGPLRVQLGEHGIAAISYKGQKLLGRKGLQFHLRKDSMDTWGFNRTRFSEAVEEISSGLTWTLEETGPLRVRAFTEFTLGGSRLKATISLYRGEPRIDVKLTVNFSEKHRVLQMPIHFAQAPRSWIAGLAGGSVRRVPNEHEWPLQSWAIAKAAGCDVGIATPDAYSASLSGDCWQWTLLRAPLMAWAGDCELKPSSAIEFTDQGVHTFEFTLRFGSAIKPLRMEEAADHLVKPPICFDRYEGMNRPAWKDSPPRRLWTPDIARAVKDGKMPHLADPSGGKAC